MAVFMADVIKTGDFTTDIVITVDFTKDIFITRIFNYYNGGIYNGLILYDGWIVFTAGGCARKIGCCSSRTRRCR